MMSIATKSAGPVMETAKKIVKEMERKEQEQLVRQFETGATRDSDAGKHDYDGFLSPLVIERFGEYMTKHREQSDGTMRTSDNWQKGIPKDQYMKSGWRHFFDWWKYHRNPQSPRDDVWRFRIEEALCALLFNVQGYLHEYLKEKEGKN